MSIEGWEANRIPRIMIIVEGLDIEKGFISHRNEAFPELVEGFALRNPDFSRDYRRAALLGLEPKLF